MSGLKTCLRLLINQNFQKRVADTSHQRSVTAVVENAKGLFAYALHRALTVIIVSFFVDSPPISGKGEGILT